MCVEASGTATSSPSSGYGLWIGVTFYTQDKVFTAKRYDKGSKSINSWDHIEIDMDIPDKASYVVCSFHYTNVPNDFQAKLSFGDEHTDWLPAVEDIATKEQLENLTKRVEALEASHAG